MKRRLHLPSFEKQKKKHRRSLFCPVSVYPVYYTIFYTDSQNKGAFSPGKPPPIVLHKERHFRDFRPFKAEFFIFRIYFCLSTCSVIAPAASAGVMYPSLAMSPMTMPILFSPSSG